MNPKVLQYNNGYPFKTGEHYVWYIAIEKQKVMGFIPLEMRKNEHIINNYYAEAETHDYILDTLLNTVLTERKRAHSLYRLWCKLLIRICSYRRI